LVEGEIDNTTPGRISGTLRFVGRAGEVTLDLAGDMAGELRGKRIRLDNPMPNERNATLRQRGSYMRGFRGRQRGKVDSIERLADGILHAAWYDETNGRVVIELPTEAWTVADEER
jgi:hypothetical protein